jgi:hypothetical protein
MSEESKIEAITATVQNRRAFVKTAAKVAVTAPAAAMLLNASVKSAKAAEPYVDTGDPNNAAGHDDAVQSDDIWDDGGSPGDFVP